MKDMDKLVSKIKAYPTSVCSCKKCVAMCKERVCWGLPDEIQSIIDAGFENRLMMDWWCMDGGSDIYILCPAIKGYEGKDSPWWPSGICTFLDKKDKCELHDLGLKPSEGRVSICNSITKNLHADVAQTWDSKKGIAIVDKWNSLYPHHKKTDNPFALLSTIVKK